MCVRGGAGRLGKTRTAKLPAPRQSDLCPMDEILEKAAAGPDRRRATIFSTAIQR
jgi:hypothetical protein